MLMRCAIQASAMAALIGGVAFTAGVGLGVAAVGGACLVRNQMKKRSSWRDDSMSSGMGLPDEPPMPGDEPSPSMTPG